MSELRGVIVWDRHMGSLGITYHPTQVNAPRHNPSQTSRYLIIYPGGMEG